MVTVKKLLRGPLKKPGRIVLGSILGYRSLFIAEDQVVAFSPLVLRGFSWRFGISKPWELAQRPFVVL